MPPMPPPISPPGMAGPDSFLGALTTMASVVTGRPATDAAFCRAVRMTLAGSTIQKALPAWWNPRLAWTGNWSGSWLEQDS
jgi:hypothetical protein